jgi:hypothetical protein
MFKALVMFVDLASMPSLTRRVGDGGVIKSRAAQPGTPAPSPPARDWSPDQEQNCECLTCAIKASRPISRTLDRLSHTWLITAWPRASLASLRIAQTASSDWAGGCCVGAEDGDAGLASWAAH